MSQEQIRRIVQDSYDEPREESLRGMLREFYSGQMRSVAVLAYVSAALCVALAVYSAMQFFRATQIQGQIMFATLFIVGALGLGLVKIFAWGKLHQSSIRRDLKRLELRVAELSEMLKNK